MKPRTEYKVREGGLVIEAPKKSAEVKPAKKDQQFTEVNKNVSTP